MLNYCVLLVLLSGCAATAPNYDIDARESVGRIVVKNLSTTRSQARADTFNSGPILAVSLGIAGLALGDALQPKTDIPVYEFRIRTEDGREVSVFSEYFASHVGDCVKLLESSKPTYPWFISHTGCR